MGLKILHSADWHLGSPFGSFSEDQRQLLRQELDRIPGKVADLCHRENCDLVLLAGDILDGPVSREILDGLKDALKACAVPVFITPGNHDYVTTGSPWVEEQWPENVHIFTGAMESVTLPELDCRIYGGAFQSMDSPALLDHFRVTGEERWQVGVLHGDPLQKNSPSNPVTAAQVRQSGLHYLALGHIHRAGAFKAGEALCAWPGCPMGRGWDETGNKGVCIVTLDEKADIRAVSLDTIRFQSLEVDIGGDPRQALEETLPGAACEDFYRITLTGYGTVDLEALRKAFAAFPNLELRSRVEPPVNLWENAGEDSLEGVYFRLLHKMLEKDQEDEKIILLAAEISKKLLDGREVIL